MAKAPNKMRPIPRNHKPMKPPCTLIIWLMASENASLSDVIVGCRNVLNINAATNLNTYKKNF